MQAAKSNTTWKVITVMHNYTVKPRLSGHIRSRVNLRIYVHVRTSLVRPKLNFYLRNSSKSIYKNKPKTDKKHAYKPISVINLFIDKLNIFYCGY